MPRASKRKLSKDLFFELENEFISLVSKLHNSSEIKNFLDTFLTKEEKIMLSKRLMMHVMLEKGHKSKDIETALLLSRETILKHKYVWLKSGLLYRNVLKKILSNNSTKKIFSKIEDVLYVFELMGGSKTNMKARAKFASGDWGRKKRKVVL